jgi:hypothetical protein
MNYKLGRKSPKNTPAILFKNIRTAVVIPPHPSFVDYLKALLNWLMLGNDDFGNCVAVTAANLVRVITHYLGVEYYPTQAEVYALYKTQNKNFVPNPDNPVQDNGMDIQTCLEYWNKNEWAGRKLIAFAKVDYANLEEVKAALAIFGCLWLGINVESINREEFDNGKAWDYSPDSEIEGGHSVVSGGYLGQSSGDVTFITWAQETKFTDKFWSHSVEEAWVVILPEHLGTQQFQQGIDLNTLAADYKTLTGRVLPLPTPVTPPSNPGCSPAQLIAAAQAAMQQVTIKKSWQAFINNLPKG